MISEKQFRTIVTVYEYKYIRNVTKMNIKTINVSKIFIFRSEKKLICIKNNKYQSSA